MSLDKQLAGLETAVEAGEERLSDDVLQPSRQVIDRATARLRVSADHTVVALGGSTGSGKSSLFNALVGIDLAGVGARRPTTTWTFACVWGTEPADGLLDWVGVPERRRFSTRSELDDGPGADRSLDGLVLLDLPDHDSIVEAHHAEVDRVVGFADLFVWVLDPQKYADAAIHERYLRPLAEQRDNTVVVMNQVDRLSESERELAIKDLRGILDREGLRNVALYAISVHSGFGMAELRAEISGRIAAKDAARRRMGVEVRTAAEHLAKVGGNVAAPGVSAESRENLIQTLEDAAGVSAIAQAVESATVRRAAIATDWPVIGWIIRFRKDPLRELGLGSSHRDTVHMPATESATVQKSRLDLALRELCADATEGIGAPWKAAVRQAASGGGVVLHQLDSAVSETELPVRQRDWWWRVVGFAQWLSIFALIAGITWIVLGFFGTAATLNLPDALNISGVPLPLWLIGGSVVFGILTTWVARRLGARSGRLRRKRVEQLLHSSISDAADREVLARVNDELDRYELFRTALEKAAQVTR